MDAGINRSVANAPYIPYHEPSIEDILIISAFVLVLNVINKLLDYLLYCGLVGQVLIGAVWGTPLAKWLGLNFQTSTTQLGYIGLILIVFEGGLSTSFLDLKQNILLSTCVAVTGIALPMGLSFALISLVSATPLQAFAAGAALCSTSLGTTFTLLKTSGFVETRLGVVLTSAAMMDDVVGLVMVQVVADIGGTSTDGVDVETIARPIGVSLAAVAVTFVLCRLVARPLTVVFKQSRLKLLAVLRAFLATSRGAWALQTLILIAFLTAAAYGGTSILFAAYLAGASISWWYSSSGAAVRSLPPASSQSTSETASTNSSRAIESGETSQSCSQESINARIPPSRGRSGESRADTIGHAQAAYNQYFQIPVDTILKPFFFASIGFSIPLTQMFDGSVVWRGIVYTILMSFAKLLTGIWLIRLPIPNICREALQSTLNFFKMIPSRSQTNSEASTRIEGADDPHVSQSDQRQTEVINDSHSRGSNRGTHRAQAVRANEARARRPTNSTADHQLEDKPSKPISLYPGIILGSAMVARGEIGFLIASTANSKGIFGEAGGSSEAFLVVLWAAVLCTVIGPLATGFMVRRVEKLEPREEQSRSSRRHSVLGVWGVN